MSAAADRTIDQLFDLAVVLGEVMNNRLAEHGLTPARAEVLWALHGTGPRTQRELSQILRCTPRNVTGLIDALQGAGLVERTAHPTDRRAIMVRLSERGRSLIAGWGADRALGTAQLLGGIPADELAVFGAVLDRVLARLRATYQPEPAGRQRDGGRHRPGGPSSTRGASPADRSAGGDAFDGAGLEPFDADDVEPGRAHEG